MNNDLASEIRNKVDIVDVIGDRIPLVAKGKNFFGVCPFHDDSNPSLSVSRDKQIYTCFSCGATGNVFTFLMNYEHITFKETLKYLGEKVNIATDSIKITKVNHKYQKSYDAYNIAVKYYQNNLSTSEGEKARKYLNSRKINDELIKKFEIGLAGNDNTILTKALSSKGYDLLLLNNVGLSNESYDTFRNRIIFPLHDLYGNIVGFSGRIYNDENTNKYLNTKETDIFKKGLTLYNFHKAKEEVRKEGTIIVMEGFMDVIRASSININNTVALMGTAVTKEQQTLIKRLSNNIVLCLDGDNAGVTAALKLGNELLKDGIEVKIVYLSDNMDPDSYIVQYGEKSFKTLIENAYTFNDFKLKILKDKANLSNAEEKSNYINQVLKETALIKDPIRIEIVLKNLAKEFDIRYNTLEKRFNEFTSNIVREKNILVEKPVKKKKTKYEKAVLQVFYLMLTDEKCISKVISEKLIFPNELMRKMVNEINHFYSTYGYINIADFLSYVQNKEELSNLMASILANDNIEIITSESVLRDYFSVIKEYGINQEIKRLTALIKEEVDPIKQAEIANKIRKFRMGDI